MSLFQRSGGAPIADPARTPAYFSTGPDLYLRKCRPYFWVPLNTHHQRDPRLPEAPYEAAIQRIVKWLDSPEQRPVTDVFIFCHGWHRNLFAAASAYDRLMGRFIMLMRTGRLHPPPAFEPLFLALHWHSDPGYDSWVDENGRRDKDSFMANAEAIFEARSPSANFTRDFELLFELLSVMSATPDDPAEMVDKSLLHDALASLDHYGLRDEVQAAAMPPPAGPVAERLREIDRAQKATMVWRCYDEAQVKGRLLPQYDQPGTGYFGRLQALKALLGFVVGSVGIGAIATKLLGGAGGLWSAVFGSLDAWSYRHLAILGGALSTSWPNSVRHGGHIVLAWLMSWAAILLASLALLPFSAGYLKSQAGRAGPAPAFERDDAADVQTDLPATATAYEAGATGPHDKAPRGMQVLLGVAWLHAQLWYSLPLVVSCFATYLFGLRRRGDGAGDERLGVRNQPPPVAANFTDSTCPRSASVARARLASLARWPVGRLLRASGADSSLHQWGSTLDRQLAFYVMSYFGVLSGEQAAQALSHLLESASPAAGLDEARFHFVGHSFGCLVVANAVRRLAASGKTGSAAAPHSPLAPKVHTLCLLQAALASDWFDDETNLFDAVRGNVACVYSRYDTATGFLYPLANSARMGAGNIGLKLPVENAPSTVPELDPRLPGTPLPKLVMLVSPPNLRLPTPRNIVNLDASRLIYQGPIVEGGGHDDIFKDDVLHLIWSVCF